MAQLSTKIKLYAEANSKTIDFTKDVILQDDSDGNGPYIKTWSVSGLIPDLERLPCKLVARTRLRLT